MGDVFDLDPTATTRSNANSEGLSRQDASKIDLTTLSPLSPDVMSRQATINIGTIGHVAHGKTTVVMSISGKKTTTFKQEAKMNITIYLGYANAKIYKCAVCVAPGCYMARPSSSPDIVQCPVCHTPAALQRHVSFVDCPGHDILMATMLNGAAIMDAAFLLVAANETFPQPQTLEHLKAVEIMQLSHIMVLQNKIDLVKEATAQQQYDTIREFLKKTPASSSPVLPISAQLQAGIPFVLEYLCHVPVPTRDFTAPLRMTVVRSFDVNKPGDDIVNLRGGVAGGSIQQGVIKVGQLIEIRPGIVEQAVTTDGHSVYSCRPILCRVVSLKAEDNDLQFAVPGGLIGVGTNVDPSLTRQNKLVGHVIGEPGTLPDVFVDVEIEYSLLPQVVGAKVPSGSPGSKAKLTLNPNDALQINIGSLTTSGKVVAVQHEPPVVRVALETPSCASVHECVAISRRFERAWRLIGWGRIVRGTAIQIKPSSKGVAAAPSA